MTLREILRIKGGPIRWIAPSATLAEAACRLVEHNVGSLLVCEVDESGGERLLGILTERDILHVTAKHDGSLTSLKVVDHMSTRMILGAPEDSVEDVMGLMTDNRIRHLPVMSDGRLIGIVSIGDVVKAQHDRLAMENSFMKDYIQNPVTG